MHIPQKLDLNIGKPKHGWLPINFKSREFELNVITSNIPKSPTEEMYDSLILCLKGVETEFSWNLEPHKYIFKLIPNNDHITLSISESKGSEIKNLIHVFNGDFNSVILPMYRNLKKFSSLNFNEEDWTKIDQTKIIILKKLITERKISHANRTS